MLNKYVITITLATGVGLLLLSGVTRKVEDVQSELFNSREEPKVTELSSEGEKVSSFKLKYIKLPLERTLILKDEVNETSVDFLTSKINKLSSEGRSPIYLLIDSPGGSVIHGATLLSAMEASKAPVNTVCLRICASMAFSIHQHGKNRYMLNRSVLMSHDASGGGSGRLSQIKSIIDFFDRFVSKDSMYVSKRAGLTYRAYRNEVMRDMWLDAEDALARRFTDRIVSLDKTDLASDFSGFYEEYKNFVPVQQPKFNKIKNFDIEWISDYGF